MQLPRLFTAAATAFSLSLAFAAPASANTPPVNPPVNPRAIVVEDVSKADFATTLKGLQEQLTKDGWNIVAEINLGERLAKKGVQIPGGLVILELTSGKYTVPLLKKDETRYVSALMPCSVSVYGMSDGRVIISRINAGMMAGMLEPQLAEAMKKAAAQLDESIARALAAK
jgi:uncharacterized protein (DUF302 family)